MNKHTIIAAIIGWLFAIVIPPSMLTGMFKSVTSGN